MTTAKAQTFLEALPILKRACAWTGAADDVRRVLAASRDSVGSAVDRFASHAKRQAELPPDRDRGGHKFGYESHIVEWAGRNPQTLCPARHGWIVYRLDINAIAFEQHVACSFAKIGVTDQNRDDVCLSFHSLELFRVIILLYSSMIPLL